MLRLYDRGSFAKVEKILQQGASITVLVNNVGVGSVASILQADVNSFQGVFPTVRADTGIAAITQADERRIRNAWAEVRIYPPSCAYCLVSDRRSAALNWEGVVPSHVRKAR